MADHGQEPRFVVLEGLDGVGKSTTISKLASDLNVPLLVTPPSELAALRPTYDAKPAPVRKAFYALGNVMASEEVKHLWASGNKLVLMDRYWPSTAAYQAASIKKEDRKDDDAWTWPSDLLLPTHVILLKVSEEERQKRLISRGRQLTWEEKQMKTVQDKRLRVEEAYTSVLGFLSSKGVTVLEVLCDGCTVQQVVDKIAASVSV